MRDGNADGRRRIAEPQIGVAEPLLNEGSGLPDLGPFQTGFQLLDAPGVVAHLAGKKFQKVHDRGEAISRHPGSLSVGFAQVPLGNTQPCEPATQPVKGCIRRLFGQHLPARNGCDVFALDRDRNRYVEKARVAGVKLGLSIGTSLGLVPAVAPLAAPRPLRRVADHLAERVSHVPGKSKARGADIWRIQRHRQAGEALEDERELGKLWRPQKLPEEHSGGLP